MVFPSSWSDEVGEFWLRCDFDLVDALPLFSKFFMELVRLLSRSKTSVPRADPDGVVALGTASSLSILNDGFELELKLAPGVGELEFELEPELGPAGGN